MKEEFKRLEIIEKFLAGLLKGDELKEFKKIMKSDKFFVQEIENLKTSQEAVKVYGRLRMKEQLEKIHNKVIGDKKEKMIVLASLSEKGKEIINKLYEKYFTPYDNIVTVRSKRKGILDEAMQEYSSGNYVTAIKLYKNILKDKPKDIYALFYCGISLLETKKFKDAKNKFIKLLQIDNNIFREQTEWYLGLTYLRSNNLKEAMNIFNEINKDNPDFRKAKNIVKKLKEVS